MKFIYILSPIFLLSVSLKGNCENLCQENFQNNKKPSAAILSVQSNSELIDIYANRATTDNRQEKIHFSGDVEIYHQQQQLSGQSLSYQKKQQILSSDERIYYNHNNLTINGNKLNYNPAENKGTLENANYTLGLQPAQGKTEKIDFNQQHLRLHKPSFSTCPADRQDWHLQADELLIDQQEEIAEGKHVTAYIRDIPVFYLPYIQFPINDKRKSGFLMPALNYHGDNGLDIDIPYYLNIAPQMDATLHPRILTNRGLLLGGEFRHISQQTKTQLAMEYIHDSDYDQKRTQNDLNRYGSTIAQNRGAAFLQFNAQHNENWISGINYNYQSDNYYLSDFSTNIYKRSNDHAVREAYLKYNNPLMSFTAQVQGYQSLLVNNHIYSKLPQLSLRLNYPYSFADTKVRFGLESEAVNFKRNWNYDNDITEARRYYVKPYIEMPWQNSYSFIKPRVSLDNIYYQLTSSTSANNESSYKRSIPIVSIDSGLLMESSRQLFSSTYTQTFEPRLYYLYSKYEQQKDFPLFDTAQRHFSFSSLFSENRFSGIDRQADANQMTMAVSSRFINQQGDEKFRTSAGYIQYFDDRKVQIHGADSESEQSSSLAMEIYSQLNKSLSTQLDIFYNHHQNKTQQASVKIQYQPDSDHLANIQYILNDNTNVMEQTEQIHLSTSWKIDNNWQFLAYWNYSLLDDFSHFSFIGVEYESCCYALRLLAGKEKDYADDKPDYRLMLQINFKGLSSIGNADNQFLEDSIAGYESTLF